MVDPIQTCGLDQYRKRYKVQKHAAKATTQCYCYRDSISAFIYAGAWLTYDDFDRMAEDYMDGSIASAAASLVLRVPGPRLPRVSRILAFSTVVVEPCSRPLLRVVSYIPLSRCAGIPVPTGDTAP